MPDRKGGKGDVDLARVDLADVDLCDLDLFAGGFPEEVFVQLRRERPVWWHPATAHTPDGSGFWVLSRHSDIAAAAADPALFSSEGCPGAEGGGSIIQDLPLGFAAGVLLNMMDDPRHQRIRRLITPALTPRALTAMEAELRSRAAAIVDAVADRGSCDFLTEVAVELPLQAVAALDGRARRRSSRPDALVQHDARFRGPRTRRDERSRRRGRGGDGCVRERAHRGTEAFAADDLISTVVHASIEEEDGVARPLSDLELLMFFNLLVVAGSETTRNSIALGMVALIEHPDQLEALRSDPSLMPTAVEEILRWTTATTYNRRTATRSTTVGGCEIERGAKVTLWWPSANRDEAVFDDPSVSTSAVPPIRTSASATGATSAWVPPSPAWSCG